MDFNSRKAHRLFFAGIIAAAAIIIIFFSHCGKDKNPFDTTIKADLDTVKVGDKKIDSLEAQIFILQDSLGVLNNTLLLHRNQSSEIKRKYEREKTNHTLLSADSTINLLFANLSDTIK